MAILAAPFIVEEFLAYAFMGGAYDALAYTVGAAASGSAVASEMLIAGGMMAGATVTAGGALVAGVGYGLGQLASHGFSHGDIIPPTKGIPPLNPPKPVFNRRRWQQQHVIKKVKRFKKRRRG